MYEQKIIENLREFSAKYQYEDQKLSETCFRAADAIEELQKPKWIPVTERLPEAEYGESEDVLTIDSLKVMRVAYFDGGNWCFPTGEPIETVTEFPITHWMLLPEPPKEET